MFFSLDPKERKKTHSSQWELLDQSSNQDNNNMNGSLFLVGGNPWLRENVTLMARLLLGALLSLLWCCALSQEETLSVTEDKQILLSTHNAYIAKQLRSKDASVASHAVTQHVELAQKQQIGKQEDWLVNEFISCLLHGTMLWKGPHLLSASSWKCKK